jgi:hypothetical protein
LPVVAAVVQYSVVYTKYNSPFGNNAQFLWRRPDWSFDYRNTVYAGVHGSAEHSVANDLAFL